MNNIIHTIRHTARAAAVLLIALLAAQTAGAWSGQGTEAEPYKIASASDLNMIYTMVNTTGTTYENLYFVQTADIDCSTLPVWNDTQGAGIGRDASHAFKGRYDGGGHKIKNLRITATDSKYAGLFGYIAGGAYGGIEANTHIAEVHDVVLDKPTITITANGSEKFAGAIVGYAGDCSRIYDNTVIGGTVTYTGGSNYNTDNSYVGGIVGRYGNSNFQRLSGNTVVGTTLSGAGISGGLAGLLDNYYQFSGNFADASISGADFRTAGIKREGALVGYYNHYNSSTTDIVNYYHSASGLTAYGSNYTYNGSSYSLVPVADNAWAAPVYPDSGTSGLTVSGGTPVVSLNGTNYSTKGDTYTIYDAAGWNIFCDFLNDNETHNRFSGKTVRLGADITVSRMAGASQHDFCGTFDGDGHTLTFNYGTADSYASDDYAAPFHYVSNVGSTAAAFRNLHVAGHIYTSAKYAAGLIAQHWGTVNVENCRVSTVIHSSVSGDGTHGGFEAECKGVLNITGCVFDGKLLTTTTNGTFNCGGFVGWHKGGTTNISNSLYAPAAIDADETEVGPGTAGQTPSATFGRNAVNSIANSYYTRTLGTAQGKQARSITASGNATLAHAGVATEYSVSGITAYKSGNDFTSGILYNNVLYAGSGDAVSLTSTSSVDAPAGYQYSYTASAGTLSGSANPYTLTMPDADVTVTATVIVIPWDGDGSEGKPYLIKYASQLDLLAHRVNGTHGETCQTNGYYNTYFKLNNDITYDYTGLGDSDSNYEAIGGYYNNDSRSFRGHFDGYSKTISGIRIYKDGNDDADCYQGIFGQTGTGADIHDLTLADARITGKDYTGGIVGYNNGGTIEQCTSAATLTTADATRSRYYGGIAGYNENGTLRDNLAIGATVPAAASNSYGAITGYNNNGTLQRNYYAACKVADTENATGLGCATADVTDGDGAVPGYLLTLGDGITSSALSITIPAHKELNSSGQLVTVAARTYNVAAEGTTIGFNSGEAEGYSASYSVNGSPVSGNSITMPAAAVNVTSNGGEPIDLWGMADGANGSSGHPYTITTTAGWNLLAGNVAAGKSYSDKYFQLGADNISISTMVGTSACHFSGHFNGNGNTLAVSMTSVGEYTAPFRYVGGATITGVHTTGTVTTAHKCATGLVGRHDGNVTISNCRSSVAIVSSVSGDGTHGGFVATGSGTATIEGCLFDGVICTTASDPTNSCGGFVGWNGGTVNISNSLYAPASVPEGKHAIGTDGCATFARNGVNSIANSYYTQTLGDAQGKACHSVTAGDGVTIDAIALTGTAAQYTVSGITAYSGGGLQLGENLYYGSSDRLSLTLSNTATGDVPAGYSYYTTNAGTLDGSTLTMPDADVTVSVNTDVLRSTHEAVEVSYVDANGQPASHDAIALDGTETSLGEGWYFVGLPTVAFDHTLNLSGDVHLILADGCTMNVTGSNGNCIDVNGSLTIYGQTDGTGTLNATSEYEGIRSDSGNITISGGRVTATGDYGTGIYNRSGTITISGGRVTVTSENGYGISTNGGNITLGCTTASDFIYVSSYFVGSGDGTLNIADGQMLFDEDGNPYSGTLYDYPYGKTLRPGLTARQAPDGNFWTTYYNGTRGFTIDDDENACAYTATYGDGKLTLHNQGKEIPAETAVIIVAENNVVSMTATALPAYSGDDNDLRGVDVDTDVDDLGTGTFYVLGMTIVDNEQHFGFHRYTGEEMAAHKAFVLVSNGQALARSLTMVFDDATGIVSAEANSSLFTLHSSLSTWFTLDGRRLQAKPSAPGIYVNNGRKVVIK